MSNDRIVQLSTEGVFRYEVISEVRALLMCGWPLSDAVRHVSSHRHLTLRGEPREVKRRTLYRWIRTYERDGPKGLEPEKRATIAGSRVLSPKLLSFVAEQRVKDRDASLPELIRQARQQGIIKDGEKVNRTTLWRACKRLGIETGRRKGRRDKDARRFAYVDRMQMLLGDFVHFRAGVSRARRVALYFLDDATRFGLEVAVGTSEQTELFLETLHEVVYRFGLLDAIYLDRGAAFRSLDTAAVLARLNIALILGTARYPQGHGKIERFMRSARSRLLRTLDGSPEVDPDPGALRLRLRHDLHEIYNHTPHEGLGGLTPWARWCKSRPLHPAPDQRWLNHCFTTLEQRRVSNDHIVQFAGESYEVPRGHAGEWIAIERRLLEQNALYVLHQGRPVRLHPVDTHLNAHSKRGSDVVEPTESTPHCNSASTMAFQQAFGPVLDADGGCQQPQDPQQGGKDDVD